MANSRTLLVYVLAIVVCSGCSSSFWVSANTVPVLKEPVASTGASPSSSQYQRYPQHHRFQQQQQLTAQHQQIQQTSRTSPSPVVAPAASPQHQSTDKSNNAPSAITIKNAWGLSAGSSDSGPYMAGHSYISGRTLEQPMNPPKSTYDLMDDRTSRQVGPNIFSGFTSSLQDFFSNGINLKSILLGGFMTYGVQNFGIPESVNQLIPMVKYFRTVHSAVKEANKEKEASVSVKVAPLKQVPVIGKDVPAKKDVIKEVKEVTMEVEEAPAPVKQENSSPAPLKQENSAPVKQENSAPVKQENSAPVKQENSAPVKQENSAPAKEENSAPEKDVNPAPEPIKAEVGEPKTRRKRDFSQADTDLTELAALVLSAIQSGECMQRSICLMGRQIGATNKGRAAFLLVDRLIPESVQGNQYFVTMKKALRSGESFCDTFRCRLN